MNCLRRLKALALLLGGVTVLFSALVGHFGERFSSNPPVLAELQGPANITSILRKSCYDCHSHETHWPWYGHLAPISYWLRSDVAKGRMMLNFSTWDLIESSQQMERLEAIKKVVEDGSMPNGAYRKVHRSAQLTREEVLTLNDWILERKLRAAYDH